MRRADLFHDNLRLEEKLKALFVLNRYKAVDLGFRAPFLELLEKFGNPHLKLPPVIHVAGTNGKGSVVAMLRSFFEADGKAVHVYTSPHLIKFNERIVLAGKEIDDVALENLIDEALELNAGAAVTFFEITTAMAFAAFSRVPADICLLEVGMGGRLDCTNVIENPALTIATTISGDHKEFLGDTLDKIAFEKAGIFKPGRPAVLGYQTQEGMDAGVPEVFRKKAQELDIPLFEAGKDWICEAHNKDGMRFRCGDIDMVLPRPNLPGNHQIKNAGAALAAYSIYFSPLFEWGDQGGGVLTSPLTLPLGKGEGIGEALRCVKWPGRLQKIDSGRLARIIPEGWELWLDGGHNDSAGQALADQAKQWREQDGKPLYLIVGMLAKKDPAPFLAPLAEYAQSISAVRIPDSFEESFTAEELSARTGLHINALDGAGIEENLADFFAAHPKPGRILICGSIYLVGNILSKT